MENNLWWLLFALLLGNCQAAPMYTKDLKQDFQPETTHGNMLHARVARNVLIDQSKRWPNNEICYRFRSAFNDSQKALVREAMDYMESRTYIRFVENRSGRKDCVNIFAAEAGQGCHSAVGYMGKPQKIFLPDIPVNTGCFTKFKIMHELMHTCGMFHQQSSHDRDTYVEIKWENVQPEKEHAFVQRSPLEATSFGYPYDYNSLMHYGPKTGSKNGRDVTVPLNGAEIGQREEMSEIDELKLKAMYPKINN